MANYRRGRINDEMQKELAQILREVKDPRGSGAFISVTAVGVTPDLKYAKVEQVVELPQYLGEFLT